MPDIWHRIFYVCSTAPARPGRSAAPLETIEPLHVRQYLTWRKSAPVRANREKALLSAIWNYARDNGYTSLANPCAGIKGNKETGRDTYVEDELFKRVHDKADVGLRDAMDLGYLTGQRVTDTRLMDERDVRDGQIWVLQGKQRQSAESKSLAS